MNIIFLAQIVIASLLVVAILLQTRGGGLGGGSGSNSSYHSKRGFEIVIFRATIILSILFAFTALIALT